MKTHDIFAIAAMALLGACGGSASTDPADGPTTTAGLMVQGGNAPVADCEAEGCNRPRIIDGLAEQYRAGAIAQQAQPSEPVQPAEPSGAMPAPLAPTEAAPAAAGQPQ